MAFEDQQVITAAQAAVLPGVPGVTYILNVPPFTTYTGTGSGLTPGGGGGVTQFAQLTDRATADIVGTNTLLAAALAAKAPLDAAEATVAAGATTDIGTAASTAVLVNGTGAAITALGVAAAGVRRRVRFNGVNTLTFNGTSLLTPTGASYTTAAGDSGELISLGGGNWRLLSYDPAVITGGFFGGTLTSGINNAPPVTLAAATTTNIGAAAANTISVTAGTGTINAFDNVASGWQRRLIFAGAVTLTYNVTSMIIPGAASLSLVAGDVVDVESLGGGNWKVVDVTRLNGLPISLVTNAALAQMAATTVKANPTGAGASPQDMTFSALAAALAITLGISGVSLTSLNLLGNSNSEAALPSQTGAANWSLVGTTTPITIGTATVQTFNTTSIQLREAAYNYATLTATAGLKSGVSFVTKRYMPSSTIAGPDMKVEVKAMVTDATTLCRGFIGLGTGSAPNIDTADPSGRNSLAGAWHDAADPFWQLGVTTSSGVATKVPTTIPVSTLNHKLWVKLRYRGFPTNTIQIDIFDNDVFVQSATFTYAQGPVVGGYNVYAYRANVANAVITSISVYGYVADAFASIGDAGSGYTVIPTGATPTINYVDGASYKKILDGTPITGWTEVGATDALKFNMLIKQDATGGRVMTWPTSWRWMTPGEAAPTVPVTPTTGTMLVSGIYDSDQAKFLVSYVAPS